MKKVALSFVMCFALFGSSVVIAQDNKPKTETCCKQKKEACSKDKKEACSKDKKEGKACTAEKKACTEKK